jgi:hypothetical protein
VASLPRTGTAEGFRRARPAEHRADVNGTKGESRSPETRTPRRKRLPIAKKPVFVEIGEASGWARPNCESRRSEFR